MTDTKDALERLREAAHRTSPTSTVPPSSLDIALVRDAAYRVADGTYVRADAAALERLAQHLYEQSPIWSYARQAPVAWDDPDPAWIDKRRWREAAVAALAALRG